MNASIMAIGVSHEQHDGCGVDEGACGADGGFEVLCQPPIAPDPREEPLDDPAPMPCISV